MSRAQDTLTIDADRLDRYQKVLIQGLAISAESMAKDADDEVDAGGHFLGSAHTMRNCRTAFYKPAHIDSENVESWEEGGSKDMRKRASEKYKSILSGNQAPPMDPATKKERECFVAWRKEELPDAWY